MRPKFQVPLNRLWIERRHHGGLEIGDRAGIVGDVIAKRVADGFAASFFMRNVADRIAHLRRRIRSAKNQNQDTCALPLLFAAEIFQDVLANQFLRRAMFRLRFTDNGFGIAADQFFARRKHSRCHQIEAGPRNQAGNDPAGARFAHRIRRQDCVSQFLVLHFRIARGLRFNPRGCRKP